MDDDWHEGWRDGNFRVLPRKITFHYQQGYDAARSFDRDTKREDPPPAANRPAGTDAADGALALAFILIIALAVGGFFLYAAARPWFTKLLVAQPWVQKYYFVIEQILVGSVTGVFSDTRRALRQAMAAGSQVPILVAAIAATAAAVLLLGILYLVFWKRRMMRWVGLALLLGPFAAAVVWQAARSGY